MLSDVNSALRKIVSHAYNEVEYYRQIFDEFEISENSIKSMEDLYYIPLLNRGRIQKEEGQFISKRYQKFPGNATLLIKRSFGSTNQPLKVYWDKNDDVRSRAYLWNLRKIRYGVMPSMRSCSFFGSRYEGNKLADRTNSFIVEEGQHLAFPIYGLSQSRLREYLEAMVEFDINWLRLHPSVAMLLMETVKRDKLPLPPNLRFIELSGEMLYDDNRKFIQDVFQTSIANLYFTAETNAIAYECTKNSLHVLEDNVIVEIIKDGKPVIGELGDIHVTSLTNYAMPFIRFHTCDVGILTESSCPCGEKAPVLQLLRGRPCEYVHSLDGQKISGRVLASIVEHTNEFMSRAICQYCFTQKDLGTLNVHLKLKPAYVNWRDSIAQALLANASEMGLNRTRWNFTFSE